jgi:hypothetical protein
MQNSKNPDVHILIIKQIVFTTILFVYVYRTLCIIVKHSIIVDNIYLCREVKRITVIAMNTDYTKKHCFQKKFF